MPKILEIVKILKSKKNILDIILVRGWVKTRRDSKLGISFISIHDGSCLNSLQIIAKKKNIKNYSNEILKLNSGCSIEVLGTVVKSIGKKQKYEVLAKKIKVLGLVKNPEKYPISSKNHTLEYLREVAHLRPRTNIIGAITRIRNTVSYAIHRFMYEKGFYWISTPIISTSDAEGAGKTFLIYTEYLKNQKISYSKTKFFGKKTFLTVSGQLNAESYACALSKVYTFGPTFRAENSNTTRHLSELWMVEPEMAFIDLKKIIHFSEKMLKYIFQFVLLERYEDLKFLSRKNSSIITRIENFINTKMKVIEYSDAIEILNQEKKYSNFLWGQDLSIEQEKFLSNEYFNSIVAIKNYPKSIKAFYMRINKDKKTVSSFDIITPEIGEIIGGSQREERLKFLDKRIKECKLKKEEYWWYRDLRKYGTVPHSGFGMGLERLVCFITGMKNVRDTIPFPRSRNQAEF
ncbi:asparagine--tRNA ligase [bacterium endosymbiont of Pedicinus badii]|uniref:asparagine--tRNA ligase n=1 Tax=bacterium endosymbiont of Pedicinus badii TaxID=1719126 RepID=UPI0009BC25B6|nr:asparagine--tRNA ligase [bacterium endosymbiont of Pedicinus badii]OQM34352.1 asparaginyl-tRNA synthetase [bacterium endosymbiont of Pedicinus badii]